MLKVANLIKKKHIFDYFLNIANNIEDMVNEGVKSLNILDKDYLQWIKELFLSALPALFDNYSTNCGANHSATC